MDGDQRRLLLAMPLHAITSTYGEAGLRDRFAAEIASWPDGERHWIWPPGCMRPTAETASRT